MTPLEKAAREVLSRCTGEVLTHDGRYVADVPLDALGALEEALARPASDDGGEPVAWALCYEDGRVYVVLTDKEEAEEEVRGTALDLKPLYLHPTPPRVSDAVVHQGRCQVCGAPTVMDQRLGCAACTRPTPPRAAREEGSDA